MYYNDIYHHGIEGQRWGVRNGPPYPLKESLSTRVGKKRALKRIDYVERKTRAMTASARLSDQLATLKMEDLKKQAEDILENDWRSERFGNKTIWNRVGAFTAGHTAAVGLATVMGLAQVPLGIALAGAAVPAGMSWIYYHYSTR